MTSWLSLGRPASGKRLAPAIVEAVRRAIPPGDLAFASWDCPCVVTRLCFHMLSHPGGAGVRLFLAGFCLPSPSMEGVELRAGYVFPCAESGGAMEVAQLYGGNLGGPSMLLADDAHACSRTHCACSDVLLMH